jgi:glyoxylase-like metal-dependent hydrolase (beta-lactamase superfamily II)
VILETFPVGPLQCNCSIVADEVTREAMVIDPGDEIALILQRLAILKLTLKQIVITHGHIDHVGAAARLKRITGATVLMNQNDLAMLEMMDRQAAWLGVAPPEVVRIDSSADDLGLVGLPSLPAEVLHTPGHTPGSICLYVASEKLLFSGDTLFAGTIGRTDLPGGDTPTILRSLREKLLPLPEDVRVIPGHGQSTLMGEEKQSNPFLRADARNYI